MATRGTWHGRELPSDLLSPEKWRESEGWRFGVDLWNNGFVWEAWEVWEGLWRQAREANPVQARFLQGLVMLAGACVQGDRGRSGAEEALFRSGLLKMQSVRAEAGPAFMGVALDGVIAALEEGRVPSQLFLE